MSTGEQPHLKTLARLGPALAGLLGGLARLVGRRGQSTCKVGHRSNELRHRGLVARRAVSGKGSPNGRLRSAAAREMVRQKGTLRGRNWPAAAAAALFRCCKPCARLCAGVQRCLKEAPRDGARSAPPHWKHLHQSLWNGSPVTRRAAMSRSAARVAILAAGYPCELLEVGGAGRKTQW